MLADMTGAACREKVSTALYFKYNTQLGPPYQVLVDTNFINFAIKNKVPCSSQCRLAADVAEQAVRPLDAGWPAPERPPQPVPSQPVPDLLQRTPLAYPLLTAKSCLKRHRAFESCLARLGRFRRYSNVPALGAPTSCNGWLAWRAD